MSKLLVLLLGSLMVSPVLAVDNVYQDSYRYDMDDAPQTYTISDRSRRDTIEDPYGSRRDSQEETYGKQHKTWEQINLQGFPDK